jgi:choline monooxygenase
VNPAPTKAVVESLIDPDIAVASTLPADYYSSPAIAAAEGEKIFGRSWQVVARREQLAKPGDFITAGVAGEQILVSRGTDRELRGFYNVCRHRAGPPATGCGNRKVFRCGYHGWTYGLDGKLLNAPEMDGTKNFCAEDFALRPVRVAEWSLWVFVNLDSNAEDLVPALRELPSQSARFNMETMKLYERREYKLDCNWKVYIDNFLEGYHLPSVHPGLNKELDYSQYTTTMYERHSAQSSPIRGPENEDTTERRYKQSKGDLCADYFWVFPNWMMNCYPDNMSLNIVVPTAPEKTSVIFEWYFTDEVLQTDAPQQSVTFSDQVQSEDGHICEVVQRNLHSRSYDRGRYSVKQEKGVHHFHQLYAAMMG